MDAETFQRHGREMLEIITTFLENFEGKSPVHNVTPGYLRPLIPDEAPQTPDAWSDIVKDIHRIILPGATRWHSPHFHAFFQNGQSYPSLLADMLADAILGGFSWDSCPAHTELEVSMLDWLAKMVQLPKQFLFSEGKGGGVIQGSASDATLIAILSARTDVANKLKKSKPDITQGQVIDKLVAYTSELSHSSVEKAGLIASTKIRHLPTDKLGALRGKTLEAAIREDKAKGLVPFFCCATFGTTAMCSYDNLEELGPICNDNGMWLHVDAAYAGSACICPEFRHLLNGIEFCTSFSFNPNKWMRVHYDCSCLWVNKRSLISEAFVVNRLYLKTEPQDNAQAMPDFRNWHISLERRFRSLKLWFVMRCFGVEGLQANIRKDVGLAKQFEKLVRQDTRFEIVGEVVFGLVCFRLQDSDEVNENLHDMINADRRIYLTPAYIKGKYTLRFALAATRTQASHVTFAWSVIQEITKNLYNPKKAASVSAERVPFTTTILITRTTSNIKEIK